MSLLFAIKTQKDICKSKPVRFSFALLSFFSHPLRKHAYLNILKILLQKKKKKKKKKKKNFR